MKKISEIFQTARNFFKDDSIPPTQRRQQILTQPIDPNGTTFPDTWSTGLYKQRLKDEGLSPVEGLRDGKPFIRPLTLAEHQIITQFFEGKIHKHKLVKVLDQMSAKAEAGELNADIPLYRKLPKLDQ